MYPPASSITKNPKVKNIASFNDFFIVSYLFPCSFIMKVKGIFIYNISNI